MELEQSREKQEEEQQEQHTGNEQELADLKTQLEEKSSLAEEYLDDMRRVQAEFENYRKRMLKDREAAVAAARRDLLCQFFAIVDNLELAVAAASGSDPSLVSGLDLVLKQWQEVLAQEGITAIDPMGETFDPETSEPMMTIEHEAPEATIVAVHRRGYRTEHQVLRPAMVTVSRGPSDSADDGEGGEDNG